MVAENKSKLTYSISEYENNIQHHTIDSECLQVLH